MKNKTSYNGLKSIIINILFIFTLATQASNKQQVINQSDRIAVTVSYGELIDKITILEIKTEKIKTKSKLRNIQNELSILNNAYYRNISMTKELESLKNELKQINEQLWKIEDDIRLKEKNKEFDEEFVQLARSVYITNDRRGDIKRKINEYLGSYLIEEKEYTRYDETA